jgi:hypothetical protein
MNARERNTNLDVNITFVCSIDNPHLKLFTIHSGGVNGEVDPGTERRSNLSLNQSHYPSNGSLEPLITPAFGFWLKLLLVATMTLDI